MRRRRRIQKGPRRPSQPKQRPHFFKIILNLESGELMIPKEFTRQFGNKIDDVAVLKVPSGRKWQVEVKKEDGLVRFQSGWRGFLKDHSISVGHFLLFRYDGNSTFSVFIFNQSACEISYPSDSEDDLEESNLHTECLIPFKKETEEEDPVEPLDVSIPSQLLISSTEKVLDKAQELQTFKGRRPTRTSFARKQRRNRNYQEWRELGCDENRPNGGKGTTFDVENDIEVIDVPSDNPNNETSISTRETSSYKMDDDAQYPNAEAENALALVPLPSGGDVCLQFNRSELSASATHGVGSNYCLELSTGNTTPTTKPNAEKNLDPSFMKNDVYITPSERCKKIKKVVAARKRLVTKTQREKAISAAQMFQTKNPSFVIIMKPSYVYKGMALHFPRCIANEYLQLKIGVHDVKLSVSNGRTWMARCIIKQCKGMLSGGWSKFVQDNKLEEGDCCVFEVSKAKGIKLRIFIFRVVEDAEPELKYNK